LSSHQLHESQQFNTPDLLYKKTGKITPLSGCSLKRLMLVMNRLEIEILQAGAEIGSLKPAFSYPLDPQGGYGRDAVNPVEPG